MIDRLGEGALKTVCKLAILQKRIVTRTRTMAEGHSTLADEIEFYTTFGTNVTCLVKDKKFLVNLKLCLRGKVVLSLSLV